jgi:hypothetical protein
MIYKYFLYSINLDRSCLYPNYWLRLQFLINLSYLLLFHEVIEFLFCNAEQPREHSSKVKLWHLFDLINPPQTINFKDNL